MFVNKKTVPNLMPICELNEKKGEIQSSLINCKTPINDWGKL